MKLNDIYTNNKDKVTFIKGIIRLSKVDGVISEEESMFFHNVAMGMELPEENIKELESKMFCVQENDSDREYFVLSFDTKAKGLFFLEEAVQLCYIDGVYHDKEQSEMRIITQELGLKQESLEKIEKWVQEGIAWQKKGEELLNME